MTDYGSLLRDHVTLRCRSIDRIFLQAYVPMLQSVGEVCFFLRPDVAQVLSGAGGRIPVQHLLLCCIVNRLGLDAPTPSATGRGCTFCG